MNFEYPYSTEMSDEINALAQALAKAQGQFRSALKSEKNPFFNSKYADLASIYEVIRDPLSTNGLAVVQPIVGDALITYLVHSSGQWMRSTYPLRPIVKTIKKGQDQVTVDGDPQAYGSLITYARRYALSAMLGVVSDIDDDGNDASQREAPRPAPQPQHQTVPHQTVSTPQPPPQNPNVPQYPAKKKEELFNSMSPSHKKILLELIQSCGLENKKEHNQHYKNIFESVAQMPMANLPDFVQKAVDQILNRSK